MRETCLLQTHHTGAKRFRDINCTYISQGRGVSRGHFIYILQIGCDAATELRCPGPEEGA